jgi:hypothetical protein
MKFKAVLIVEAPDQMQSPNVGLLLGELVAARLPVRVQTVDEYGPRISTGLLGRPPVQRLEAILFLERFLAGRSMPAGDVFREAQRQGLKQKTVRRAADDIEVVKEPPTGRACHWRLP